MDAREGRKPVYTQVIGLGWYLKFLWAHYESVVDLNEILVCRLKTDRLLPSPSGKKP